MIDQWALEPTVFKRLEAAKKNPPGAAAFESVLDAATKPQKARIEGTAAVVEIKGILTKAPDWIARWLYGANTTYADIVAAVRDADNDPRVESIVFDIESPGGSVHGMFDAMAAIAGASKPTHARVEDLAASAAYGLASQADTITTNNAAAAVGSVGVVYSTFVSDNEVNITSTDAPNKRPDVTTEEGRAVVRGELDAIHDQFAGRIAEGRGLSLKKVNANFGRGGIKLADEALAAKMIDGIDAVNSEPDTGPGAQTEPQEAKSMTLEELQAAHPDLFAQVQTKAVDGERDRVGAHLDLGKSTGAMDFAVECIKDGATVLTDSVQAKYLSARITQADVVASEDDDAPEIETPTEPEAETKEADFMADVVSKSRVDMKGA